jgi:pyrroloquinoline quinone (PQQ) biosynthesis protein C
MNFYDRLLAETAEARSNFISLPLIGRALNGDVSRQLYLEYLAQAYHHVRHTCPLLALAASRTGDDRYQGALFTYLDEEKGHQDWILDDIRALGGDAAAVARGKPGIACRLMVSYAYYAIDWISPYSLLGMVHVLEGMSVNLAESAAAAIQRRFGLTEERGVRYLRSHGALDIQHLSFLQSFLNGIGDRAAEEAIVDSANMFYRLYSGIFVDLADRHAGAIDAN